MSSLTASKGGCHGPDEPFGRRAGVPRHNLAVYAWRAQILPRRGLDSLGPSRHTTLFRFGCLFLLSGMPQRVGCSMVNGGAVLAAAWSADWCQCQPIADIEISTDFGTRQEVTLCPTPKVPKSVCGRVWNAGPRTAL